MEKGRRLLQDYDAVMDKVAEAEELSADHRPSTLEKLAELASDTSAPVSYTHLDVYKRQVLRDAEGEPHYQHHRCFCTGGDELCCSLRLTAARQGCCSCLLYTSRCV